MNERFSSRSFVMTMLLFDVLFIGIVNSGVLPFNPSPLVVGFALFGVSPALAYLVTEYKTET